MGLSRNNSGFTLTLDDGEVFTTCRVVVAAGVGWFAHVPRNLAHLPPELLSHSSAHHDLAQFKGRDVTVLGGGSSAIDLAALLHEQGAVVRLVARTSRLEIHSRMRLPRPLIDRLREPMSGIGPSWRSFFFVNGPLAFHYLPEARRLKWVRNHLGPAGGWFMAERLVDRVPLLLGHALRGAHVDGGQARLRFATDEGRLHTVKTDHVIAATGYRPDVSRLKFLDRRIVSATESFASMPILSSYFESTVRGLYFVGPISANSFGSVMRFAVGAKFTAARLSRHLAAAARSGSRPRRTPVAFGDLIGQGGGAELRS